VRNNGPDLVELVAGPQDAAVLTTAVP